MAKEYVLDTSAIFTLVNDEDGSDVVEKILNSALRGRATVYLSFITLMEVYYVTWKTKNESTAKELIILLKSLPVHIVNANERITLSAGRLKALHRLSVADALIAATAIEKRAILVHKDPEMKSIANYTETIELPYKR